METTTRFALVALMLIALFGFFACGLSIAHMQQIIHDQREYIELGCTGRYQGED